MAGAIDGGAAPLLGVNRSLIRGGYVQVVVDVRGTGASTGKWDFLGEREQQDTIEVFEWAQAQPWSNGRFAMSGASYMGVNTLLAAGNRAPGLEAVFALVPSAGPARDLVIHGGGHALFTPLWVILCNILKFVPNPVELVKGVYTWRWLADRLRYPMLHGWTIAKMFFTGEHAYGWNTPYLEQREAKIENVQAATLVLTGWHDLLMRSATATYQRLQLPPGRKQLIVGDFYHGNPGLGFGKPGAPPRVDVLQREKNWYDRWLKDIDNGVDGYGPVTIEQQGGDWITAEDFPQPGASYRRLYLSGAPSGTAGHARLDGSLGPQPPTETTKASVRRTLRGLLSRTTAKGSGGATAILGRRLIRNDPFVERKALTFTTAPATRRVEISGTSTLHLRTITDRPEGFWVATLNAVDPDGRSTVLADGALLSSLRAIDEIKSVKTSDGDYALAVHPLNLESALPVTPGEPTILEIDIPGTDAILEPGHRLRVNISAADFPNHIFVLPTLRRLGLKPQHVELAAADPSYLVLPIIGTDPW